MKKSLEQSSCISCGKLTRSPGPGAVVQFLSGGWKYRQWCKCVEQLRANKISEAHLAQISSLALSTESADHLHTIPDNDPLRGIDLVDGRYRVVARLGVGGMGTVYKVTHESLNKTYALKALNPMLVADAGSLRRFEREAKTVSQLSHPNLLTVVDYGTLTNGAPYLVMDYVEGTALDDEIRNHGPLEPMRLVRLFSGVCSGLSYAHRKGLIHRDIKPGNIVITRDEASHEICKIVDFGVAKRRAVDEKLTQTGEVFGTPLYMSPEQIMAQHLDVRSDIYSLGCVMYEAIAGKSPFAGNTPIDTIFNHLHEPPKRLKKTCPNVPIPDPLDEVIQRCLEKDSKDRPSDAAIVGNILDRIAQGLVVKVPRRRMRIPRALNKALFMACFTLAGAVTATLVLILWNDSRQKPSPVQQYCAAAQGAVASGNYSEAVRMSQQALSLLKQGHYPRGDQLKVYDIAARSFALAGKRQDSVDFYIKAADTAEHGRMWQAAAQELRWAAHSAARDDANQGRQLYLRALQDKQMEVGKESPELLPFLTDLALVDISCKQNAECEQVSQRVLEIAVKNEKDALAAVSTYKAKFALGCIAYLQARFDQALRYFDAAEQTANEAEISGAEREQLRHWRGMAQRGLNPSQPQ